MHLWQMKYRSYMYMNNDCFESLEKDCTNFHFSSTWDYFQWVGVGWEEYMGSCSTLT